MSETYVTLFFGGNTIEKCDTQYILEIACEGNIFINLLKCVVDTVRIFPQSCDVDTEGNTIYAFTVKMVDDVRTDTVDMSFLCHQVKRECLYVPKPTLEKWKAEQYKKGNTTHFMEFDRQLCNFKKISEKIQHVIKTCDTKQEMDEKFNVDIEELNNCFDAREVWSYIQTCERPKKEASFFIKQYYQCLQEEEKNIKMEKISRFSPNNQEVSFLYLKQKGYLCKCDKRGCELSRRFQSYIALKLDENQQNDSNSKKPV